jgi:hypothetical protein
VGVLGMQLSGRVLAWQAPGFGFCLLHLQGNKREEAAEQHQ